MYPPLVKYLELWATSPLASNYYFYLYFLIFISYFYHVACEYTCQPLQVLVEMRTERNVLLSSLGLANCHGNSLYYIMLRTQMYHPWFDPTPTPHPPSMASACEDAKINGPNWGCISNMHMPHSSGIHILFWHSRDSSIVGGYNTGSVTTLNLAHRTMLGWLVFNTACSGLCGIAAQPTSSARSCLSTPTAPVNCTEISPPSGSF